MTNITFKGFVIEKKDNFFYITRNETNDKEVSLILRSAFIKLDDAKRGIEAYEFAIEDKMIALINEMEEKLL
jgi:flagellar assembly factor FliW